MGKVEVWESLPTFEMHPGKTFFGLDKNKSHCFTLPKQMTDPIIRFFGLREGKLQTEIEFVIDGYVYPATVRWARIDRSRPRKLEPQDLPKRDVVQFQWKNEELTASALRIIFQQSYTYIQFYSRQPTEAATFSHLRENKFLVQKSNDLLRKN